jgi:hypothetical protein
MKVEKKKAESREDMNNNFNEFIDKIVEKSRIDIHFPYHELASQLNIVNSENVR